MRTSLAVPQFVIINGFDSIEISAAEIALFKGA